MPPGDSTVPRLFINTPKCSPFLVMSLRQLATLQYFLCWGWGGRRRGRRGEARRGQAAAPLRSAPRRVSSGGSRGPRGVALCLGLSPVRCPGRDFVKWPGNGGGCPGTGAGGRDPPPVPPSTPRCPPSCSRARRPPPMGSSRSAARCGASALPSGSQPPCCPSADRTPRWVVPCGWLGASGHKLHVC